MTSVIKKVPIPIAGLMLALASTGNLVAGYGSHYRTFFGILGAIALALLTTKILTHWSSIKEDLKNPVIASVAPTYTMGLMILSTYIKPSVPALAYGVWVSGLIIHALLIFYFVKAFILKFTIKNIFPSCFIVFVGIVVGSVTAPAYNALLIGKILFWFGLLSYLILLPIVAYRVFKFKNIPEPAQPTIAIFAAPASLCLAGYMSSFQVKNMFMIGFLTGLSLLMTFAVLLYLPKLLKLKFYPSYSAFTFPLVISAIAIKMTSGYLASTSESIGFLRVVGLIEEWIAILIVLYVVVRYVNFFLPVEGLFTRKDKTAVR